MLGIVLSLFPLFGWGASDYISSKLSKKYHSALVNLLLSAVGLLPGVVICLFLGFPEFTAERLLGFWLASIALSIGFISMVRAFSRGATGIVAPIANSYAIITALIATLFLGEVLSFLGYAAMLLIILGIVLMTYKKDPSHNKKDFNYSVNLSVLAMITFGIGFALFGKYSDQSWYQDNMLFQMVGTVNAFVIYAVWVKKDKISELRKGFTDPIVYLGGAVAIIGTLGLFGALDLLDNVSIPAAIAAASPLVTAFLAYRYDKEHLRLIQRVGSIAVVVGIIMISFAS